MSSCAEPLEFPFHTSVQVSCATSKEKTLAIPATLEIRTALLSRSNNGSRHGLTSVADIIYSNLQFHGTPISRGRFQMAFNNTLLLGLPEVAHTLNVLFNKRLAVLNLDHVEIAADCPRRMRHS